MKHLWTYREIGAPADVLWELLTNTDEWPRWGPSVRKAVLHDEVMERGSTGTVTTAVGVDLPFEVTAYEPGERWAWKVGGVEATDHRVVPLQQTRCRVGFGVPVIAAPYLAVCRLALDRLHTIATESVTQP